MSNGSKHHAPCIDLKHSPLTSCEHFFFLFFFLEIWSSYVMESLKVVFVIILGLSSGMECA